MLYYLRNSNWIKLLVIFVHDFVHIDKNLSWNLYGVLQFYYLLPYHFYFSIVVDVSYCFRPLYLSYDLNLNWSLNLNLYNLWLIQCVFKADCFLNYFIHIHNFLYYLFGNNWLLNDKLYWNLLHKWNQDLPVFNSYFVNLNYFLNNSVFEHFHRNLSYDLSWNSSFSLYNFRNLFFYDYLYNFFLLNNFYIFDYLNLLLVDIDIFYNLYLSNHWDLSDNLNDL